MLYTEEKERENRFKLALRMGIPVFSLAVITITSLLLQYFHSIPSSFIIIAFALLGIMVYYLFYLIYAGFNERITEPVTHTFTRAYFKTIFEKEVSKADYTLLLFTIDNLDDINRAYGITNGDLILKETARQIGNYLDERGHHRVAISHFKGGDFIVGLNGTKEEHRTMMDIVCMKYRHIIIEDIEVDIIGAMSDSKYSTTFDALIEHLFDIQNENRNSLLLEDDEQIDYDDLEQEVIDALNKKRIVALFQPVFTNKKIIWYEMVIKLKTQGGRLIHQKSYLPVISRLRLQRRFDLLQFETAVSYSDRLQPGQMIAMSPFAVNLRKQLFFEEIFIYLSNNAALQNRFIFLVGESNYYHQRDWFNARIQAYRRAGIKIAVDHLGGYHSALRYVNDLNIDIVRFERYLGKHLENKKVEAILIGLNAMAKYLGITTWVRMIENESTYQKVLEHDIDAIQGNYLARMEALNKGDIDEIR